MNDDSDSVKRIVFDGDKITITTWDGRVNWYTGCSLLNVYIGGELVKEMEILDEGTVIIKHGKKNN